MCFRSPRRPIQHFISPRCQYHIVLDPVTALPKANTLISELVYILFPFSSITPRTILSCMIPLLLFLPSPSWLTFSCPFEVQALGSSPQPEPAVSWGPTVGSPLLWSASSLPSGLWGFEPFLPVTKRDSYNMNVVEAFERKYVLFLFFLKILTQDPISYVSGMFGYNKIRLKNRII